MAPEAHSPRAGVSRHGDSRRLKLAYLLLLSLVTAARTAPLLSPLPKRASRQRLRPGATRGRKIWHRDEPQLAARSTVYGLRPVSN